MADSSLNINIKSHVELSELRKMEDQLQRQIVRLRLAKDETKKLVEAEKQLSSVRAQIKNMPTPQKLLVASTEGLSSIPGVGGVFRILNGSLMGMAAGGYAIAKAFKFAKDSISSFAVGETSLAKLNTALANSGNLTESYKNKLEALAASRSKSTAIDDRKYIGVFTTLTKFGASPENIDKYTRAVENLAGFMGGDIEQAATLFGRAMQGNVEMLGRYGISVDRSKSQTQQLQDVMLQLEVKGGGQLQAMADTTEGALAKLGNSFDRLKEKVGGFLTSLAGKDGLKEYFSDFAEGLDIMGNVLPGGKNKPTQLNKTILVGNDQESQAKADELAGRIDMLRDSRRTIKSLQKDDLDAISGSVSKKETQMRYNRILTNHENLVNIDKAIRALEKEAEDSNIKRGTVEEAAKSRGGANDELASKREEMELELRILEAKAVGNEKEQKALEWQREYNRLLEQAQNAGMGESSHSFAIRGANALTTTPKEDLSAGREALALELKLAVAKATGNDAEVRRLEWIKEYVSILKQAHELGLDNASADQVAKIGANARRAEEKSSYTPPPVKAEAGLQTIQLARLTNSLKSEGNKQSLDEKIVQNTKTTNETLDKLLSEVKNQKTAIFAP